MLRSHVARVIADEYGPYGRYLEEAFYTDVGDREPTVESCLRDIDRSKDRHIVHYREAGVERGAGGDLAGAVVTSTGIAKAGFAYRVRALVYLRNRCAHHSRLWHHSVLDAGPTPNNVRKNAKRRAGQFEPRSVLDVISARDSAFWQGLTHPQSPRDHSRDTP